MVRKYVPMTKKPIAIGVEKPKDAKELIRGGIVRFFHLKEARVKHPLKRAVDECNVTKPTLHRYTKGHASSAAALEAFAKVRKVGHPTTLPKEVEDILYSTIITAWRVGCTLSPTLVMALATRIANERGTPFKGRGGVASADWLSRFCKDHKLSRRSCKPHSKLRTAAENETCLTNFFDGADVTYDTRDGGEETIHHVGYMEMLDKVCDAETGQTYRYRPDRIGNADETNLVDTESTKGIAPTGVRHVPCAVNETVDNLTVLSACVADGSELPDMIVKKGVYHSENIIEGCDEGTSIVLRKDGYFMTWEFFVKYLHILAKMIKGGVSVTNRFLLLLDGHGSRIHPACVDAAQELGFDILLFPGGVTHLLQPMDQLFGPIKTQYRRELHVARNKQGGNGVSAKWKIQAWTKGRGLWREAKPGGVAKIRATWEKLGLFPPSRDKAIANMDARKSAKSIDEGVVAANAPQAIIDSGKEMSAGELHIIKAMVELGRPRDRRDTDDTDDDTNDGDGDGDGDGDAEPLRRRKKRRGRVYVPHAITEPELARKLRENAEDKEREEEEKEARKRQRAANKIVRDRENAAKTAATAAKRAERAARLLAAEKRGATRSKGNKVYQPKPPKTKNAKSSAGRAKAAPPSGQGGAGAAGVSARA
jgi:hypothetical protein